MARPTLEQRIVKAVESDDFELAKQLKEELKARKELEKLAKKKKPAAKKTPAKKPARPKKTTKTSPANDSDDEEFVSAKAESDFAMPQKDGGKRIGKLVPFNQKKRVIKFFDDNSSKEHSKIEKKIWKNSTRTERRPPAEKTEVECYGCSKSFKEYISKLVKIEGELKPVLCPKCSAKGTSNARD